MTIKNKQMKNIFTFLIIIVCLFNYQCQSHKNKLVYQPGEAVELDSALQLVADTIIYDVVIKKDQLENNWLD